MKIPEKPPANPSGLLSEKSFDIMEKPEFSEILKKVDEAYLYWSEFKYKDFVKDFDVDALWHVIRLMRKSRATQIKLEDNKEFLFEYNLTLHLQQKLHEFDLNLGGRLESDTIIPNEDKTKYLLSSIMEEAIASSQMEGAVTTRKVAKDMLRSERPPKNKSEQMILNNYATIKRLRKLKDQKLSIDLILEIHALIADKTLDDPADVGRFRQNNEVKVVDGVTGEVVHAPPNHERLPSLMQSFCDFANETHDASFIHPIVRASILHFLIGYIHPFVDGNGRTARAVFYWYLLRKNYWLIEYLSVSRLIMKSKVQYAKAYLYSELDGNDLTYFIQYKLKMLEQSFAGLKKYIEKKINARKQLYDLRKIEGINDRQIDLIRMLLDDQQKVLTIKEVQNIFGVVYQTARSDLIGLKNMNLVQVSVSGKKKLVYFRSEGFDNQLKVLCSK